MQRTAIQTSGICGALLSEDDRRRRNRVWIILCRDFFQPMIDPAGSVLDIATGYGEFINNITAAKKYAIDANPLSAHHVAGDVQFTETMADDLSHLPAGSINRAFTSNFLEHLPDKAACDRVLREVLRVLKPSGKLIALGPNIRYAYDRYWDYYDYYLPLSDASLADGMAMNGFEIETVIPRFLPLSMKEGQPTADFLVKAYLRLSIIWPIFGKQFVVVGRKPATMAR